MTCNATPLLSTAAAPNGNNNKSTNYYRDSIIFTFCCFRKRNFFQFHSARNFPLDSLLSEIDKTKYRREIYTRFNYLSNEACLKY